MSDTVSQLSDALDVLLLRTIRDGVPLRDSHGQVRRDERGEILLRPATAAEMQAARGRLRDLGAMPMIPEGSAADELADELDYEIPETIKLPSISEEPDAGMKGVG